MNAEFYAPYELKGFYERRRGFIVPTSSSNIAVKEFREHAGGKCVRFTRKIDEDLSGSKGADSITFQVSRGRVVGINIRIPGRVKSWIINFNSDGSCEYRHGDRTVDINEFNEATCESMGKWSKALETIAKNSDRRRKTFLGIGAGALLTLTKSSSPLAPAIIQPSAKVEEEVPESVSTPSIGNKPVDQTRETARRTIGDVLGKEYFDRVEEYKRRYPYDQEAFENWTSEKNISNEQRYYKYHNCVFVVSLLIGRALQNLSLMEDLSIEGIDANQLKKQSEIALTIIESAMELEHRIQIFLQSEKYHNVFESLLSQFSSSCVFIFLKNWNLNLIEVQELSGGIFRCFEVTSLTFQDLDVLNQMFLHIEREGEIGCKSYGQNMTETDISIFDFYNGITMERIDSYVGELPEYLEPFYKWIKSIGHFILMNINDYDISQRNNYLYHINFFIKRIIELKELPPSQKVIIDLFSEMSFFLQKVIYKIVKSFESRIPFPFEDDEGYRCLIDFLERNLIFKPPDLCKLQIIEYGKKMNYSWAQISLLLGAADSESNLRDLQWGNVEFIVTKNRDGSVNLQGKPGLTCINKTLLWDQKFPSETEEYFNIYLSIRSKDLLSGKPAIYFYASVQDRRLNRHPILKIELSEMIDTENLPDTIKGFRTGPINGTYGETGPFQIHPSWRNVDAKRAALLGTHNYAQYYPQVYSFGEEQMTVASLILHIDKCHSTRDYMRCLKDWNTDEEWLMEIRDATISYYNYQFNTDHTNKNFLPATYISESVLRNLPE